MPQFLAELKGMGFSGVQNFPTIGLFDGNMRQSFEETGMGFGLEVDMIAEAHRQDLLTTPYVFNPDEAIAMARAGADIIVAHMGVTTGGSIGATSAKTLDQCVTEIEAISAAARSVRKDIKMCIRDRYRDRSGHSRPSAILHIRARPRNP